MLPMPAGRFELQKGYGDMLTYKIMLHKILDGSTTKNIILYFMSKTEIYSKGHITNIFPTSMPTFTKCLHHGEHTEDVYLYIFFPVSVALKCFRLLKITPEKYNPLK